MDRSKLRFEDFEEFSLNAETGGWGRKGVNVYYEDHYVGEIEWKTEEEVADLTDEEVEEMLLENGILI